MELLHFCRKVCNFLNVYYPDRRIDRDAIGHHGLHILDFFVGLHVKKFSIVVMLQKYVLLCRRSYYCDLQHYYTGNSPLYNTQYYSKARILREGGQHFE